MSHDPSALFCEANLFRYRPVEVMGVVFGIDAPERDRQLLRHAASIAGVKLNVASDAAAPEARESLVGDRQTAQ